MLRLLLVSSSCVFVAATSTACFGGECNAIIECQAPLVVDARVPLAVANTSGLGLKMCRNGTCVTGMLAGTEMRMFGAFDVDVAVKGGAAAPSDIVFTPVFAGFVNGSGDVSDGDTYEVVITNGPSVILDNTRKVDFAHGSAGCRSGSCYEASYTVTPASASGIECHMNGCPEFVASLAGTFSTSDLGTPVTVVACRNSACSTGSVTLPTANEQTSPAAQGPGLLTTVIAPSGSKFSIEVDASAGLVSATDPYHDGDVYSVTVTQASTTLLSSTQTVTYAKTFPNGAQCDSTPCLSTTISL